MTNYYPRIDKLHINCIDWIAKGESLGNKNDGVIVAEYKADFLSAYYKTGTECLFTQDVYYCDIRPVYPYYVLGWDNLRKLGVMKEYRAYPEFQASLCKPCTLLAFGMKTRYYHEVVKKFIPNWYEFVKVYDSARAKATYQLQDKATSAYNLATSMFQTFELELHLNGDINQETHIAPVGRLVRLGMEKYYKDGIVSATFSRLKEVDGS